MVEIKIAKYAGYCFGVKRALKLTEEACKKDPSVSGGIYTLGHIIHNPGVVKELEKKNVFALKDIHDLKPEDTLVIRSHGVSPQIMQELEKMDIKVIDATCPFVRKAQKKARRLSKDHFFIVLIGDKEHPEVIGIKDHIMGDRYVIVDSPKEASKIPFQKKIGVVIQTTQTRDTFQSIVSELIFKCETLLIENTICSTTEQRQDFALKIASEVDIMIVVGGKNSANTRHLAELPRSRGFQTYHIENHQDIDPGWFDDVKTVGITGGASTPMRDIINVKKHIESLGLE